MDIQTIYDSLINGQRRQMVDQILEYGLYDFWGDYKMFLSEFCYDEIAYEQFTDVVISYFKITSE